MSKNGIVITTSMMFCTDGKTVPKKEKILVLPYLGVQIRIVTKQLKTCVNIFYGCSDPRVIFQSASRIKSFFPTKI